MWLLGYATFSKKIRKYTEDSDVNCLSIPSLYIIVI
jgi:hypothetical protein